MCGIVGAVAQRNIVPVLIEGLRRLEYRGYDSCGVAVLEPGAPKRARSVARVADLDAQVRESHLEGTTGVAHTRWATHGAPVTHNAHPIFSSNALALVHNGIIENFESLREALRAKLRIRVADRHRSDRPPRAQPVSRQPVRRGARGVGQLHGAYAIAVIQDQPHTVVGARQGSPLVVGHGDGENFLASDALALAGSTDRFTFLEEGDVRAVARRREDRRPQRRHRAARDPRGQRLRRRGRTRAVSPLHAEGNLRAAARDQRYRAADGCIRRDAVR